MKSVVINFSDAISLDNFNARFWLLNGSMDNANNPVNEKEERLLSYFFKKIKKDFGISDSLKSKMIDYLEAKHAVKNLSDFFSPEEEELAQKQILVILSYLKNEHITTFSIDSLEGYVSKIKEELNKWEEEDKIAYSYLSFISKSKKIPTFSVSEIRQVNIVLNAALEDAVFLKNKEIENLKNKYLFLETL